MIWVPEVFAVVFVLPVIGWFGYVMRRISREIKAERYLEERANRNTESASSQIRDIMRADAEISVLSQQISAASSQVSAVSAPVTVLSQQVSMVSGDGYEYGGVVSEYPTSGISAVLSVGEDYASAPHAHSVAFVRTAAALGGRDRVLSNQQREAFKVALPGERLIDLDDK